MNRRSIPVDAGSREATNTLLRELRGGRWRPVAWRRFVGTAVARSARQATRHRRAVVEVTLLHGAVLACAGGRGRVWTATSWLVCVTHLGLLGARSSVGPATVLTLVRANLPTTGVVPVRWLGVVALATDVADGRLARRLRAETMFGGYADALADATFWTWFALRHEPSRWLRTAAVMAWAMPVVGVTVASVINGRLVEVQQSSLLRPAAALQLALAARAAFRAGT